MNDQEKRDFATHGRKRVKLNRLLEMNLDLLTMENELLREDLIDVDLAMRLMEAQKAVCGLHKCLKEKI